MINKISKLVFLILLLSLGFTACKKNSIHTLPELQTMSMQIPQGINEEAYKYFQYIKQIVFATNSNSITTFQNNDSLQLDPIYLKLQSLDIINEDNQQSISFFNLIPQEQIAFFDELAIAEALQMTEKIVGYPDIELDIKKQNELIGETIDSFINPKWNHY